MDPQGWMVSQRVIALWNLPIKGVHSVALSPLPCPICFIIINNHPHQLGTILFFFHQDVTNRSIVFLIVGFSKRKISCWKQHFWVTCILLLLRCISLGCPQAVTYFFHPKGSWKHDIINNFGNHETVGIQFMASFQIMKKGCMIM